jgi:hypothetical protein
MILLDKRGAERLRFLLYRSAGYPLLGVEHKGG